MTVAGRTSTRLLLAVAAIAAGLLLLLARGWRSGGADRGAETREGPEAVAVDSDGALGPPAAAPPAERTPTGRGERAGPEPSSAEALAEASTPPERTPFDYGVRGLVHFRGGRPLTRQGDWRWPALDGTVRATDSLGWQLSDRIENDGTFELWGLGPGAWTVVADLGDRGRAEVVVQLSPVAPETFVELWPDRVIAVEIRLRVPTPPDGAWPRHIVSPIVAAHHRPHDEQRTWLPDLGPVSTATLPLSPRPALDVLAGTLFLPEDEELTLSLFVNELWVTSRVRKRGESRVEWNLSAGEWPTAFGRLEVRVVEEPSGTPLDYLVRTPGWRGRRIGPDDTGKTIIENVPPGWREVMAGGGDHERIQRWLFVGPGETASTTLGLRRGVILEGTVTGPDGEPAKATVAAWRWDPVRRLASPGSIQTCRSGRSGRFFFPSMRAGTYLVRSIDADEPYRDGDAGNRPLASRFLEVEAFSDRRDIHVELEPVSTLMLVRSQLTGGPLTWHVEDEAGRWLRQGRLTDGAPFPVSLPLGSYRLVVESGEGDPFSRSVELGPATQRIEL